MESKNQSNKPPVEPPKSRKHHPLYKALFLDVLFDRRTRPIFIYAAVMLVIGAALFHFLEGWTWLDSFYFVVITLTTIGYGDFVPTMPVTKLITIFYGLNGIIMLLMLFDVIRTLRGWEIDSTSREAVEDNQD